MFIYEVNLELNPEITKDFLTWLPTHINEVLAHEGFSQAKILHDETSRFNINQDHLTATKITVQYIINSEIALKNYLQFNAPQMRQTVTDKYGTNFSSWRRVFREV